MLLKNKMRLAMIPILLYYYKLILECFLKNSSNLELDSMFNFLK